MKTNLDELDCKILFELEQNTRSTVSELARRLRMGRDRVEYRIDRLISTGIIRGFSAILNPYSLGLSIYKTYLTLQRSPKDLRKLLSALELDPHVYWIAESSGRWDLIIATAARSPRDFYDSQTQLLSKFGSVIREVEVYAFVDVWINPRKYLIAATGPKKGFFFGGEPQNITLSDIDRALIQLLLKNSRRPTAVLAHQLGISPQSAALHIEGLLKSGVISGFQADLDLEKLGRLAFKTQVFFERISGADEEQFREYCLAHPLVTFYVRQIGSCSVEVETEVESYQSYIRFIDELREKFAGVVSHLVRLLMSHTRYTLKPALLEAGKKGDIRQAFGRGCGR